MKRHILFSLLTLLLLALSAHAQPPIPSNSDTLREGYTTEGRVLGGLPEELP